MSMENSNGATTTHDVSDRHGVSFPSSSPSPILTHRKFLVSVEVCLKPSSTARIEDVRLAVERMLEKRSLSYADGPIPVPSDDQILFENVQRIGVCDTAGWEGSAHDSRVLSDALSRSNGFKIPEEMSFTQNEKCKGKHFTWSKPMSHMLLEILAEETLKGSKPSSTFKAESFVKVATEISQKFNVQCEPKHVENHLKTVKKEWGIITKLKNKSGFGWDDCLKMITVSKDIYDEEVKAHPNHDKYLNKKLDMYEIMTIVVGKDMATGNYAKSYVDVNLEENTEEQSISIENEREYEETSKGKGTSSSSTQKRQHRKRNRMYEDDGVEKLSKQIGDVAFAIQSLSKNQLDVNALYAEVMKVDDFDEITLGDAFDHLVQNEMLAKAFMAKNANLRKIWVQNFVTQHCYRPAC